ncbi:MAG: creatininase family protein [Clostridia bacterium]|nr:creatininase family protein [Clostridia bacterium]
MKHGIFTKTMADMTWPAILQGADENAIVLLPMGVIEEHGPHLCLATDIYTAHIQCGAVKQALEAKGYPALIAPPFYWGVCQSAGGFIGSFNIRPETATALLFDILASLGGFGFTRVFAVNAHGDVAHKIAAVDAFREACEKNKMTACFPYDDFMLNHFGWASSEPCFYTIPPQIIKISEAAAADVHAGDVETAAINQYYPSLADTQKAKSLPDVSLGDNFEAWMFGSKLKQLSPLGYIGSPSSYESVDILKHTEDTAHRLSEAIIARLNR